MKLICVNPKHEGQAIIYLKPDTALVRNNDDFYIPEFSEHISSRLALVIKMKKLGKNIAERFAHRYYEEVGAGLCFEASDVLEQKKQQGLPWDEAVGFDYSAPLSPFMAKEDKYTISLKLNGNDDTSFNIDADQIDQIIAACSRQFTLKIGDFIYITSPSELTKLAIGQSLQVSINEKSLLDCNIK